MDRLSSSLSRFLTFIGGVALVAMMLQVNIDVVGKYFFNWPVPLTMEMVSYYYMAAVTLLPLAALERKGSSLVHVELVYDYMPGWLRRIVFPAALLLSAVYCACAGYAAWNPAMSAYEAGSYAGSIVTIVIWPTRFFPVIGFGLLALVLTLKAIGHVRSGLTENGERPNLHSTDASL